MSAYSQNRAKSHSERNPKPILLHCTFVYARVHVSLYSALLLCHLPSEVVARRYDQGGYFRANNVELYISLLQYKHIQLQARMNYTRAYTQHPRQLGKKYFTSLIQTHSVTGTDELYTCQHTTSAPVRVDNS
jgi:hypothetical protein